MRRQLLTAVGMVAVMTLLCGLAYGLALTGVAQAAFGHQANGSFVEQRGKDVGSSLIGQPFTDSKGNPIPRYFQSRPSDAVTSSSTDDITVSGASNLGPSNPLLIGFVPGVNSVALDGKPSRTNPFATPADPFCVPVDTSSAAVPVVAPTPDQKYARNTDGTYVCDPDTVPERAIAYRTEFGLAPNAPVPVDAVTASGSGLDPEISITNADIQAPTVARARNLPLSTVQRLVTANTTGRSLGLLGDPGVNVLNLNLALDSLGAR
jgi:potassium-transporting ATPase KdpC subunit